MQGIYTYIPEAIYVPREYSIAAIPLLLFIIMSCLLLGIVCQFVLVDSTIWLPCLLDVFLLLLLLLLSPLLLLLLLR